MDDAGHPVDRHGLVGGDRLVFDDGEPLSRPLAEAVGQARLVLVVTKLFDRGRRLDVQHPGASANAFVVLIEIVAQGRHTLFELTCDALRVDSEVPIRS